MRTRMFTLILALAIPVGAVVAAPAAFADSTICSANDWTTCPNAGRTDHGYGTHNATSYWTMYAGHNCTNYVAYVESAVNGAATPSYNLGSAYQWASTAGAHGVAVNGTPALGAVAQWNASAGGASSSGHVAYVEAVNGDGSITVSEDDYPSGPFRWRTISAGSSSWPSNFIHFKDLAATSYADGTYVQAGDTGNLYRMAGGAPMYVTSLGNVPWSGQYQVTTQAAINAMPRYPADGTAVRNYSTGGIYVVAGGFPFAVASLANIPNTSWVDVDGWSITNQLRAQPVDGTVIRNYTTGGIFVVAGDAALAVVSLSNIPYQTWTNVDGWAIAHQLATYPVDGTVIRNYSSGGIFVVAGGSAVAIASLSHVPYTAWTEIDGWAITNQLRAYPADGTYIVGYQSGEEFVAGGGAVTRVTTTPPPAATAVDDWAITNQLGGTL